VHTYPHMYSVDAASAEVLLWIVKAVADPTGMYTCEVPFNCAAAAFAEVRRHFANVEYAVPKVPVTIVADALGPDPVVTVMYPETSFELAFALIVGLVPAPAPAAQVGTDA
jgi:hypothetical protein